MRVDIKQHWMRSNFDHAIVSYVHRHKGQRLSAAIMAERLGYEREDVADALKRLVQNGTLSPTQPYELDGASWLIIDMSLRIADLEDQLKNKQH